MSRPRNGSLGEVVYAQLRQRVVDGQLRPGVRVRESELATSLGVSRTPVREALGRLQSEGLLTYQARGGAVIAELTPQRVLELYSVREILEGAAARFAAQYASDEEIRLLRELLDQQRSAGSDSAALAKLNRTFHEIIYRMAHNHYLLDILQRGQDHLVLLVKTTYLAPKRAESAYVEHSEIVNAIARRDPDMAELTARRHIREARRVRMMMQFGIPSK